MASGNGPYLSCIFFFFFFSFPFVLRERSVDPSKRSDLRRLRCTRRRRPHPAVPDRAAGLRQHTDGVWLTAFSPAVYLFFCVFEVTAVRVCACVFFLLPDD